MAGFEPPGPGQPPEEPPGSPPPPSWPPRYPVYGGPQGGDHSSALKEAEHTRKLAGWALGLSFVFCMPLAALTAIGLAITALVQGSRARHDGGPVHDYGTGMAIAALPIAVVSLVIGGLLIVLGAIDGFNEDDDEAGDTTSSSEVGNRDDVLPSKLREGDCFNEPQINGLGPTDQFEATTVEVVVCKLPHDAEVFHAFQMPDGDFPGEDAINRQSLSCAKEFRQFVGVPYTRSDLDFIYYFPTEDSWDILDDRGITCSIFDPKGKISGTLARSRR